jgi:hypothetical protein
MVCTGGRRREKVDAVDDARRRKETNCVKRSLRDEINLRKDIAGGRCWSNQAREGQGERGQERRKREKENAGSSRLIRCLRLSGRLLKRTSEVV